MMLVPVLLAVAKAVAPLVLDVVKRHAEANGGELPTDQQVRELLDANIERYLAEGRAWLDTHPSAAEEHQ